MPKAKVFWEPPDTLRFALGRDQGSRPGSRVRGGDRRHADDHRRRGGRDRTVAGSTCSPACPRPGAPAFPAGEFAQEPPDMSPAQQSMPGLFEDTLPELSGRQRRTDRVPACRLRPVLVVEDRVRSDWPTGSHPMRCWYSTSSSTIPAGGSTSTGHGPSSSRERAVRSNISAYTGNNEQVVVRPALISCRRAGPSSRG